MRNKNVRGVELSNGEAFKTMDEGKVQLVPKNGLRLQDRGLLRQRKTLGSLKLYGEEANEMATALLSMASQTSYDLKPPQQPRAHFGRATQ